MKWALAICLTVATTMVNLAAGGYPLSYRQREAFQYTIGFVGPKTPEEHQRAYDEWYFRQFGRNPYEISTVAILVDIAVTGVVVLGVIWVIGRLTRNPPPSHEQKANPPD
jgi:hypothetical protein